MAQVGGDEVRVVPLKFSCCSQYQQAVQRSLQLQQQQALLQQQQQMLMQQQQPLYQPQVAQAQAQYAAMVSDRVFSRPCGDASNSAEDGTSGR